MKLSKGGCLIFSIGYWIKNPSSAIKCSCYDFIILFGFTVIIPHFYIEHDGKWIHYYPANKKYNPLFYKGKVSIKEICH